MRWSKSVAKVLESILGDKLVQLATPTLGIGQYSLGKLNKHLVGDSADLSRSSGAAVALPRVKGSDSLWP